jgi:hypothetical protein
LLQCHKRLLERAMYLRLRKRRKPLATDTSPAPLLGTDEAPAPSQSDWVPAEPTEAGDEPAGTDVATSRHPNRGKARESSRGSHR